MQTVLMFAAKALSFGKAALATAGHAAATAGRTAVSVANGAGAGGAAAATGHAASVGGTVAGGVNAGASTAAQILNGLRVGTSAVSALSTFAMGASQAAAMEREAFDEQLAARNEHTQAMQRATAIEADYNLVVGQQLAIASASGIDVGSGSVIEARRQARQDADRQIAITRTGADMNAALRRARARALQAGAGSTRLAAFGQAGAGLAGDYLDRRKVG